MAVPMAAVARLVLANVDHPIPRSLADALAGTSGPPLPPSAEHSAFGQDGRFGKDLRVHIGGHEANASLTPRRHTTLV